MASLNIENSFLCTAKIIYDFLGFQLHDAKKYLK